MEKTLYSIHDRMCDELEDVHRKIEKSDKMSESDLELIYKLTDIIKDIETIIAMEERGDYSGTYYDGGMSYARGRTGTVHRDSMGRYSRGYSRDDARHNMIRELHDLMNDAPDDLTKEKFRRFISEMENG